jgi:hypothetical protein
MQATTTIGLDIAKSVVQVHGIDGKATTTDGVPAFRLQGRSAPHRGPHKKLGANGRGRCKLQNIAESTSNEARNHHGFGDAA